MIYRDIYYKVKEIESINKTIMNIKFYYERKLLYALKKELYIKLKEQINNEGKELLKRYNGIFQLIDKNWDSTCNKLNHYTQLCNNMFPDIPLEQIDESFNFEKIGGIDG